MKWSSPLITIGAVALGWLLGETSQLLKGSRQRREAVGLALVDLLALRHELKAIKAFAATTKKFELSAGDARLALQAFMETRKSPVDLQARLAAIVSCLASFDPLLAWELRTKTASAGSFVDDLRGSPEAFLGGNCEPFLEFITNSLEIFARRMAWRYGAYTWLRLRLLFLTRYSINPEMEEILTEIARRIPENERLRRWRNFSLSLSQDE